ncbi:MAG: hypothetical protein HWE26_13690 [Alteromonadaceae bacterium]|nr:hypothetical protein [Alteromonadaceae bacterium]
MSKGNTFDGVKVMRGTGDPVAYTEIAGNIADVKLPSAKANFFERTSHKSGGWKEWGKGLLEVGSVTLKIEFGTVEELKAWGAGLKAKDTEKYRIQFPPIGGDAGGDFDFEAFVESVDPNETPIDGQCYVEVMLKPTGAATWLEA